MSRRARSRREKATKGAKVGRLARWRRRGWEDGLLAGDPRWMVAGALAWTVWLVRWGVRRQPEVVYRTRVKPGETLVISSRAPVR